jgi:hypothetical protein
VQEAEKVTADLGKAFGVLYVYPLSFSCETAKLFLFPAAVCCAASRMWTGISTAEALFFRAPAKGARRRRPCEHMSRWLEAVVG